MNYPGIASAMFELPFEHRSFVADATRSFFYLFPWVKNTTATVTLSLRDPSLTEIVRRRTKGNQHLEICHVFGMIGLSQSELSSFVIVISRQQKKLKAAV